MLCIKNTSKLQQYLGKFQYSVYSDKMNQPVRLIR